MYTERLTVLKEGPRLTEAERESPAPLELSWANHLDVEGRLICTGDPPLTLIMMSPDLVGQFKNNYFTEM